MLLRWGTCASIGPLREVDERVQFKICALNRCSQDCCQLNQNYQNRYPNQCYVATSVVALIRIPVIVSNTASTD